MSFSADVKNELCSIRTDNITAEAECYGMLVLCRSFSFDKILLQTGNLQVAEKFCALLRCVFDVITFVKVGGEKVPVYSVSVQSSADRKKVLYRLGYKFGEETVIKTTNLKTEGSVKAFARGAFLAAGQASDPSDEYRIEFSFKSEANAKLFKDILHQKGLEFNITNRAKKFVVYTKNSTVLEDALTFIGAGTETLNLIGVKVYKSIRNRMNRQNNFETSNILKSANAAYAQRKAIEKLKAKGKLQALPEELYEVAVLRLENPEASLSELCRLSKQKLTRSGFNHRMQKLLEMAESKGK